MVRVRLLRSTLLCLSYVCVCLSTQPSFATSPAIATDPADLVTSTQQPAKVDILFADIRSHQLKERIQKLNYTPKVYPAVTAIAAAQDALKNLEEAIRLKHGYSSAIQEAEKAVAAADAALIEIKRNRSKAALENINKRLTQFEAEGASTHAPERLHEIRAILEKCTKCHYRKDYDAVVIAEEAVKPLLNQLATVCRIENTNKAICEYDKTLAEIKAGAPTRYIGSLANLEERLDKARLMFNNSNYEGASFECEQLGNDLAGKNHPRLYPYIEQPQ